MWIVAGGAVVALWMKDDPSQEQNHTAGPTPGTAIRVYGPGDEADQEDRSELAVGELSEDPPGAYRGGARHAGRFAQRGPSRAGLLWRVETRGRTTAQAIVDLGGDIFVGSHDGTFRAINPAGNIRWQENLGGPIYSTALLASDGNLYIGSDAGMVFSFTRGGRERWRMNTEDDADTGLIETPDGRIVFAAGLDVWSMTLEGEVQWRFSAREKIFATPAVDSDGTVYVGSQDDHFYAIAPDGRMRWAYRTGDDNDSSPVIGDDGTIYFGSDDRNVYALTRNGELKWSKEVGGMVRGPASLSARNELLVPVFGPHPRVVALSCDDGEEGWSFSTAAARMSTEVGIVSGPIVDADGAIYFGSHDDFLYSLSPEGELRWVFEVGADVDAPPVLSREGHVIFGSDDRHIYALAQSNVEPAPDGPPVRRPEAPVQDGSDEIDAAEEPSEQAETAETAEAPADDEGANEESE